MRTGIEQARLDLAKWEAIAAQDRSALAAAERYALLLREQVERSAQTVRGLKDAVDRWNALQARHEPPNAGAKRTP